MNHACPVNGCTIKVPQQMFMCARHWRMVPRPLQAAVYGSYRSTGRLSANHREAVRVVNAAQGGRAAVNLPAGMKALTIHQPWASLIMLKAKPHEFRHWNFSDKPHLSKLIGQRIVIHASARPMRVSELKDLIARIDEGESALDVAIARPFVAASLEAIRRKAVACVPLAAALGTAVIGQPRSVVDLFADSVADSDRLNQHMYGWPLTDPLCFPEPLAGPGAQGFWNFS